VNVLYFILSYVAGFCIILLVASAVDTVGLILVPSFCDLKRIIPLLVLGFSALATYLGVMTYSWLASVTSLHISCAILTLVVMVEYSNDSVQYRTAHVRAVLTLDKMQATRLDAAILQAKARGHVFGFAIAALAHLRAIPAF